MNKDEFDSLIKKTITSNTELALFQRQQSLALDKFRKKSKKKSKKGGNQEKSSTYSDRNTEQSRFSSPDGLKKNNSFISTFRQAYRSRKNMKRTSSADNINSG